MSLKKKVDTFCSTLDEETGEKVKDFFDKALLRDRKQMAEGVAEMLDTLVAVGMSDKDIVGHLSPICALLLYLFEEDKEIRFLALDYTVKNMEGAMNKMGGSKQEVRDFVLHASEVVSELLKVTMDVQEVDLQ